MKKFLVLLIFAFAFQAQAQIDPSFGGLKQYKSQSSKADETRNTAGLNLDNFSTLNWKSDERFKVITTNGQGLPLSLEGKVDQGRSSSWESKAQIWLEATAEVMLQDERTEFVKEKLWTDALGHISKWISIMKVLRSLMVKLFFTQKEMLLRFKMDIMHPQLVFHIERIKP